MFDIAVLKCRWLTGVKGADWNVDVKALQDVDSGRIQSRHKDRRSQAGHIAISDREFLVSEPSIYPCCHSAD